MTQEEAAAYKLSDRQWDSFLKSYSSPAISGWTEAGTPTNEYSADTGSFACVHSFIRPDGRTAFLRIEVARTDEGPRSVNTLSNLMTCVGSMKYGETSTSRKLGLFKAVQDLCERDSDRLHEFGLFGTYRQDPPRIETWEELGAMLGSVLEKVAEKQAGKHGDLKASSR